MSLPSPSIFLPAVPVEEDEGGVAMTRNSNKDLQDHVVEGLDAILEILRDLFILVGKNTGLSRDRVRDRLGVSTHRVTAIWRDVCGRESER